MKKKKTVKKAGQWYWTGNERFFRGISQEKEGDEDDYDHWEHGPFPTFDAAKKSAILNYAKQMDDLEQIIVRVNLTKET
jgi:hypothetical protein